MLDKVQQELLYWITLYYGVLNNLFGDERAEAVKVMDDDAAFDRWLLELERERESQAAQRRRESNAPATKRTSKPVSKEKFMKEFDVMVE